MNASTYGIGNAGAIKIIASDAISLSGEASQRFDSGIASQVESTAEGNAGGIEIITGSLSLTDRAGISASTFGKGNAGAIKITANDTISLAGKNIQGFSGIFSGVNSIAEGNAGGIEIITGSLSLNDGATISAETLGAGKAGNITITANTLESTNASQILTSTQTSFDAGDIILNIQNTLQSNDSTISTAATTSSGGSIDITAGYIRLSGNSDIRTNVASGTGGGGDITLTADSIVAFNDSDILAFAQDGIGGNITLNTPIFFGNGYQTTDKNQNPDTLDNNERVDINASGAVSGVISVPDLTFIQNSLFELTETLIDTENLLANSCVVPNQQKAGTFILTGPDGLPVRPNTTITSPYPTGTVETIPTPSNSPSQTKIDEPQGFYRLPTGQIVLSRKCF